MGLLSKHERRTLNRAEKRKLRRERRAERRINRQAERQARIGRSPVEILRFGLEAAQAKLNEPLFRYWIRRAAVQFSNAEDSWTNEEIADELKDEFIDRLEKWVDLSSIKLPRIFGFQINISSFLETIEGPLLDLLFGSLIRSAILQVLEEPAENDVSCPGADTFDEEAAQSTLSDLDLGGTSE